MYLKQAKYPTQCRNLEQHMTPAKINLYFICNKRAYQHTNRKIALAHNKYSLSLAGGGDNTVASGNTGPVCLQMVFGGRTIGRSGFKLCSFDLSSIGCGCLAEVRVSFFCSSSMIPTTLFTTFGPVTFVKVFPFTLKDQIVFPCHILRGQIFVGFIYSFSHNCFELQVKGIRLTMAESI